jgi:hypothetical protein
MSGGYRDLTSASTPNLTATTCDHDHPFRLHSF